MNSGGKETKVSNRDEILSVKADIVIGRTCEKRGCIQENKIKKERGAKNHKITKTDENTSIYKQKKVSQYILKVIEADRKVFDARKMRAKDSCPNSNNKRQEVYFYNHFILREVIKPLKVWSFWM